jgi:hypothetical protein
LLSVISILNEDVCLTLGGAIRFEIIKVQEAEVKPTPELDLNKLPYEIVNTWSYMVAIEEEQFPTPVICN